MKESNFWEFTQNNSGGSFDVDSSLTHRVVVEAASEEEAIRIGENLGIYFNGCDEGMDCPCCGDRWYTPSRVNLQYGSFTESEAIEISKDYLGEVVDSRFKSGKSKDFLFASIEEWARYMAEKWGYQMKGGFPDTRIHFLDGSVAEFYSTRK